MNGEAKRRSQISLVKFRFVDETVNYLLLVRRGSAHQFPNNHRASLCGRVITEGISELLYLQKVNLWLTVFLGKMQEEKTQIAQFSLLLGTLYPTLSILYHLLPATVIFFLFVEFWMHISCLLFSQYRYHSRKTVYGIVFFPFETV